MTAAAGDVVWPLPTTAAHCVIWPDGLALATGATLAAHTAVDGTTDSSDADAPNGFVIVGAA